MTAETIDILIPHHNDVAGLALSLRSIGEQTMKSVRVVIADDGSTEANFREVRNLADASLLNTRIIRSESNLGRPRTRNRLLDAVTGPFVAWLDAGDAWYPEKLELQLRALRDLLASEPRGSTWVTCNYDWRWIGHDASAYAQETDQDQQRAILQGRTLRAYLWTLLGPAESFRAVGYFDENLPRLQDVDYFMRFLQAGGVIHPAGTQRPLCVYNKSDSGRDAVQIRACGSYLLTKYRDTYSAYGAEFTNSCVFEMDLLAARYAFNNRRWLVGLRYGASALRARPRTLISRIAKRSGAWLCRRFGDRTLPRQ